MEDNQDDYEEYTEGFFYFMQTLAEDYLPSIAGACLLIPKVISFAYLFEHEKGYISIDPEHLQRASEKIDKRIFSPEQEWGSVKSIDIPTQLIDEFIIACNENTEKSYELAVEMYNSAYTQARQGYAEDLSGLLANNNSDDLEDLE